MMNAPFDLFNPATTRWDPNNALALAIASQLAYSEANVVAPAVQQWGFDPAKFVFFDRNDTQGFVAATEQMIVISFRGTQANDIWDWMTDGDIVLHPFPEGMVHSGFYNALSDVWLDLLAAIRKFQDQGQSIWITGHSLGAALGCLAAARLIFEQKTPINGLYTYGQPRTGNLIFARHFDAELGDQTFRFVNDSDIVTRIPPRVMGYWHAGRMMFFDADGVLQNDDHWWNEFIQDVEVGVEGLVKPPAVVEEHAITLYISHMQANLNGQLTW